MPHKKFVLVCTIAFVALIGTVVYLCIDRARISAQSWSAGIQNAEETLRQVNALELMLDNGDLDEIRGELERYRLRSLTGLATIMAQGLPPNSPNLVYARRVFCAERPIDLLAPINGSENASLLVVRGVEAQCEKRPGV
jgi:hypothetical protein